MKNLAFTLAILLFFSSQNFSQEAPERQFHRIEIGPLASPELAYRHVTTYENGVSKRIVSDRNERETPRFGYSIGAAFQYNFNEHIGIQTGGRYSLKGYDTKTQDLTFQEPEAYNQIKFRYAYSYFDIPLMMKVRLGSSPKLGFVAGAGLIANLFLSQRTTTIRYNDGKLYETDRSEPDYRSIQTPIRANLSPTVSLGMDIALSERLRLLLEPSAQFMLIHNYTVAVSVKERFWSVGFQTSLMFGL